MYIGQSKKDNNIKLKSKPEVESVAKKQQLNDQQAKRNDKKSYHTKKYINQARHGCQTE